MFPTLINPSSGTCDCVDELPHRSSCSQFVVCWSFWCGWFLGVFVLQAEFSRTKSSNTPRTKNKTTDVVIHQHSRKFLKMAILISETCWAHNKWNKIESDIKLVFHSWTIAIIHGPINIRLAINIYVRKPMKDFVRIYCPPVLKRHTPVIVRFSSLQTARCYQFSLVIM